MRTGIRWWLPISSIPPWWWPSLIGIFFFGDQIPLLGWVGIAIIIVSSVASTVLIARRRVPATLPHND